MGPESVCVVVEGKDLARVPNGADGPVNKFGVMVMSHHHQHRVPSSFSQNQNRPLTLGHLWGLVSTLSL